MKLSNTQIINLIGSQQLGSQGAFNALHGILKKVGEEKGDDGKTKPVMEVVPYDFDIGVRMTLALLQSKLTPFADAVEKARNQLIKKYKAIVNKDRDPKTPVLDVTSKAECWEDYHTEHVALMGTVVDVGELPKLSIEDLKVDENKLPSPIVALLIPLVSLPEPAAAKKAAGK